VAARITRADAAPPYAPPLHQGVDARRLQGLEAGATDRFWVGVSVYQPGGSAQTAPAVQETVYVVVDGELVLTVAGEGVEDGGVEEVLRAGDSVHLPKGTVRTVENRSDGTARLLVVIATPPDGTR
jgi:mannose-6-phosphate isomerase-like protein (cupin superfamily)